ncbi:hypothetical protein D8S82_02715 [Mycobacterium hodleri]|uniref:7-cyano-7-deazaguanine synthase n=1 Tax=Mycolicibacterium hodleri TaxID=49897 RepID=A0A544W6Y3_9MYCO|nr:hypothetical protein D8S82_02715 [Mycolicibacterium hodleri]
MNLEIRPSGSSPVHGDFAQVRWGNPGTPDSDVNSTVDAWLSELGDVSDRVVDLVRLASSAYIADRLRARGAGFSRTMRVHVHLTDSVAWTPLLGDVERILGWVSGDKWELSVSCETGTRTSNGQQRFVLDDDPPDAVSLLSGGLDSLSGAVLRRRPSLFLSHTDNPTVTGAQRRTWKWLTNNGVDGTCVRISISEASRKRESTTRTRALLFYALAVALADACHIGRVEVPENGFTGLNLSFGNDRGGVLSTRSTHPWTMHLVQNLLDDAGIEVKLLNPYEWLTKGELVRAALEVSAEFDLGLVTSLSCAKLDGRTYKGGNQNWNCGLCVACLTRRAAIRMAGIQDKTPYLATSLTGPALIQLQARRGLDVRAVTSRIDVELDEFTLLEGGPYPGEFDLGAAVELCRRGFVELAALMPELNL